MTVRVRPEYARLRVVGRDRPRAAVRGHARDRRRGVRARRRRDRRDRARGRRAGRRRVARLAPGLRTPLSRIERSVICAARAGALVRSASAAAATSSARSAAAHPLRALGRRRPWSAASPGSGCRSTPMPGPAPARRDRRCPSDACRTARARRPRDPHRRRARSSPSPTWRASWQETILLVDRAAGPRAIADGLAQAAAPSSARTSSCCVDVGGDVLGDGTEPGLASPLCDAVHAGRRRRSCSDAACTSSAAVFGPVLRRRADARGAARPPRRAVAARAACSDVDAHRRPRSRTSWTRAAERSRPRPALRRSAARAVRSARRRSATAAARSRCRRSARSPSTSTRRSRSTIAARWRARSPARRASSEANELLHGLGVRTELDYERALAEAIIAPMPWVETTSLSFTARHESAHDGRRARRCSRRSRRIARASRSCSRGSPGTSRSCCTTRALQLGARPALPSTRPAPRLARRRAATWPAGSRRARCTCSRREVLRALAGGPGLARGADAARPQRVYTMLVVGEQQPAAAAAVPAGARSRTTARVAWLAEGAAQYFSGQVPLLRAAIATRLRARAASTSRPRARDAAHPGRRAVRPAGARARRRRPACGWPGTRWRTAPARRCEEAFDQPRERGRARAGARTSSGSRAAPRAGRDAAAIEPGEQRRRRPSASSSADREQHAERSASARPRGAPAARAGRLHDLALQQHLARDLDARLGHQHVARPGGEEVGDVEAGRAAQRARHALLEQQHLDELGLRLLARRSRPGAASPRAYCGLDLARPLAAARCAGSSTSTLPGVGERHAALGAEALVERVARRAAGQASGSDGFGGHYVRRLSSGRVLDLLVGDPERLHARAARDPRARRSRTARPGQKARLTSVCDG